MTHLSTGIVAKTPAFISVQSERINQEHRWGEQNHPPEFWLAILSEEVGEVARHIVEASNHQGTVERHGYRNELVQVAAVAIAAIESLDRSHEEGLKRNHWEPDTSVHEITESDDDFLEKLP